MNAYFHKMDTPNACLVIQTSNERIGISISADDSCGVLDNYRRFNIWYWDKDKGVDTCEDGFNLTKVIFWLMKIKRYERKSR